VSGGHPAIDLAGRRYGHLVVIERVASTRYGSATWRCICTACGALSVVIASYKLVHGRVRSCGCEIGRTYARGAP
jgi:hypothetical protein